MRNRVIALCDINSCYASIAIQEDPSLRGHPVAVCGSTEKRSGIVLAANRDAKLCGVKTGMVNRDARATCPDLLQVPPDFHQYQRYSSIIQHIYEQYGPTEMFSIDEGWIDLSGLARDVEDGAKLVHNIAAEVMSETGLTISCGVADNKITAKLGSEYSPKGSKYKMPGTITAIPPEKYQEMCYGLAVDELLGIGRKMGPKMCSAGLFTIGDLANTSRENVEGRFGKMGIILQNRARGLDASPVVPGVTQAPVIKSFGNTTTTPFDLTKDEEIWVVLYNMADAVSTRLRRHGYRALNVEFSVRDSSMMGFARQHKLENATDVSLDIAHAAFELFKYNFGRSGSYRIRNVGVRATDLKPSWYPEQTTLFDDPRKRQRQSKIEHSVDDIRRRFGFYSMQRAVMLAADPRLIIDAAGGHTVHPHSFM
jgi:DNA polymerase-4